MVTIITTSYSIQTHCVLPAESIQCDAVTQRQYVNKQH